MGCHHNTVNEKDWLPSNNGILRQHPFCSACGLVKNISSDKGKKLGYFTNVLARMKRDLEKKGYKISKTQIRMIISDLTQKEIEDTYSFSFTMQKRLFLESTAKFIKVSKETLESYL